MGDNFQIIADVEATEAEAPPLAESVVTWLAENAIIAATPADCVLGSGPGYSPGPGYTTAVSELDVMFLELRTNGVEVLTTKTIFFPVQGELGPAECPHCRQVMVLEDPGTGEATTHWEQFSDALDQWWAGGPGEVACPHCTQRVSLNDWQWVGGWPIAAGFLGFTFWNWPPLSEEFIAQMATRLGHQVVVTKGKL
jgi:hypothetical protein